MLVVADNSPVRYLRLLDCDHVLPALFGRLLIPPAVLRELQHPHTPEVVRLWMAVPPPWLVVRPLRGQPGATVARLDNRLRKVKRRDSAYTTLSRTVSKDVQLHVPKEKVRMFCQRKGYGDFGGLRPIHKPEWLSRSDVEIIQAYNAELRGFATYYSLATDVKQILNRLEYIWKGSLLKTLANKHKTSVGKISRKLKQNSDYVYHYRVKGIDKHLKLYALKDLKRPSKSWTIMDVEPNVARYTLPRTEIVQRLNAQTCEY
jgi:Type II intron maturase